MKSYKQYSLTFISLVSLLVLFHVVIWNLYTKHVFPNNHVIGDLGRMSYKMDSLLPRNNSNTLPKRHFELDITNHKQIDLITIGDSFSNGGGGGKNTFYQDYLASDYKLNILNIQNIKPANNFIETLYMILNSGVIENLNPKVILIESTESQILNTYTINPINTQLKMDSEKLLSLLSSTKYKLKSPDVGIINNLNVNAVKYNIFYRYDDNAYNSNCYITQLKKDVFSSKDSRSLLFYKQTIPYNASITTEAIERLNTNLNALAIILKSKNIQLYFMPAVDKFNLYAKYIVDNKYPKNNFFEQLRTMHKEYRLIDTKAILEREVDKGIKDVFYPDDTHWSYKASRAISKSLVELQDLKSGADD